MTQPQPQPPATRTRSWGFRIFLASLVAWPVLELWVLWLVVGQIGLGWSLLVMVGTAVLGGWLMIRESGKSRKALAEFRATGRRPEGAILDALLILVGGILLLLPGFIGDVVGLVALLPFTRPVLRRGASALIDNRLRARGVDVTRLRIAADRGTVIEGETVADDRTAQRGRPEDDVVIRGEIEP